MAASITGLYTYPLKSGKAVSHKTIAVDGLGLAGDRRYVLVDRDGRFLSQRRIAAMARIELTEEDGGQVTLSTPDQTVTLAPTGDSIDVSIWQDQVSGASFGLADALGILPSGARLVRIDPAEPRFVNDSYTSGLKIPYAFADGFPLLIASTSSLDDLNTRILTRGGKVIPMSRFRPNIVVSGWPPFAEHGLGEMQLLEGLRICLPKPCTRCIITTIDQRQGLKDGDEPLATLKHFSATSSDKGVLFGQNGFVVGGGGELNVGDVLV